MRKRRTLREIRERKRRKISRCSRKIIEIARLVEEGTCIEEMVDYVITEAKRESKQR